MSWWSSANGLLLQDKILQATSENIPSGEQELALNLEISDLIRSKSAPADESLKVLKRRLYHRNPNVQILALHLLDLLVKNGGAHFVQEVASKDFVDSYVAQVHALHNQNRSPEVLELMLEYLQTWALATKGKKNLEYLYEKYETLKRNNKELVFPEAAPMADTFLDSATAPEWIDSDVCMKSGQAFTFYNRKHHCRNCGGVFLQEYCHDFLPLPHYGITNPERVCVDCTEKLKRKYLPTPKERANSFNSKLNSNNRDLTSKYDKDLKEAIALSLRASQVPAHSSAPIDSSDDTEAMDEDLKRAIEASLADMKIGGPAPSSQDQSQVSQPSTRSVPQSVVKQPKQDGAEKYIGDVNSFAVAVSHAQPRDAVYNEDLIGLNRKAIQMQAGIVTDLQAASNRLQTLEDLHGRLVAINTYYNRILEQELNPSATPAVPAPAPADAPVTAPSSTDVKQTHNGSAPEPDYAYPSHSYDEPKSSYDVEEPAAPEPKEEPILIEL